MSVLDNVARLGLMSSDHLCEFTDSVVSTSITPSPPPVSREGSDVIGLLQTAAGIPISRLFDSSRA
jgi:hypothetical protein